MSRPVLHIVSGIPPGSSGTGRLLTHLTQQAARRHDWDIRFHFPHRSEVSVRNLARQRRFRQAAAAWLAVSTSRALLDLKLRWLERFGRGVTLVFHPQTLGYARTLRHLRAWRGRAFLFGLDNSFFCVRSYNHLPGELQDCLRCLEGHFEAAREHACPPFPGRDPGAYAFVRRLHELLQNRSVGVLAQNRSNAELYRRHVGARAEVQVVGLWTADWTASLAAPPAALPEPGYDVVFHGHFVGAKGADWLLEVARRLPQVRFLFPTGRPAARALPDNVTFRPMSWETGLAEQVASARIACVPSLWSATIEGALIKTIIFARATARVRTTAAYGEELPEGLVLNLDPDPVQAAGQLAAALAEGWTPDARLHETWVEDFKKENVDMLGRILRAIARRVRGDGGGSRRLDRVEALERMQTSASGLALEKLGSTYGGWVVPVGMIERDWICYCVGAGEDVSFDCALIERFGCDVFVFDPTPRAVAHVAELKRRVVSGERMPINNSPDALYEIGAERLDRLHFEPYGVWSADVSQRFYMPQNESHVSHSILNLQHTENYFEAECRKLVTLMRAHGHRRIDLLKLDIEGAEYEVLTAMLADGIRPTVLCVEFDEGNMPLDGNAAGRIGEVAEALAAADYALVRQDGWNTLFIQKDALQRAAGTVRRAAV